MIRFLEGVRSRAQLGTMLMIVVLVLSLVGCREKPPPNCGGGEGSDRPTFAATDSAAGASCDIPPCEACGGGTGDPHVTTFDGLRYDYQGAAEVVAARAPDGSFEVQWRTEP